MGSCLGNNTRLGWEEGAAVVTGGFWHVENGCLFLMLLLVIWLSGVEGWGVLFWGFFPSPPPFFSPTVTN